MNCSAKRNNYAHIGIFSGQMHFATVWEQFQVGFYEMTLSDYATKNNDFKVGSSLSAEQAGI